MIAIIVTLLALYAANRFWRNDTAKIATIRPTKPLPYRVERSGARMAGEAAWRDSAKPTMMQFGQGGLL